MAEIAVPDQLEHPLDGPGQPAGRGADPIDPLALLGEALPALRHFPELDHAQHHRHRRVELVAGDLDERPLEPVGLDAAWRCSPELGQQPVLLDDQVVVLDGLPHDDRELVGIARLGEVTEDVSLVDRIDHRADVGYRP